MTKRTAREENIRTLAELAGLPPDKAQDLLKAAVLVTTGESPHEEAAAKELTQLLSMTLIMPSVSTASFQLEVVIGDTRPVTNAPKLYVTFSEFGFEISQQQLSAPADRAPRSHFAILLAAQYAAGQVFLNLFGDSFPIKPSSDVSLDLRDLLGEDIECLFEQVFFEQFHQAGVGAIGTWFLWALRGVADRVSGNAVLCDGDKCFSEGNLQRYGWISKADIDAPKASRMVELAQGTLPHLKLIPFDKRVQDLKRDPAYSKTQVKRLVVAADSRRARRELQNEIPSEVFDASTTGAKEIILHFSSRPIEKACMSCVYMEDSLEQAEQRHIAESLGVPIELLKDDTISAEATAMILGKYPALSESAVLGTPYATLFKQLCGQQKLVGASEKAVLTPFAFVSAMAGTYLAIEFLRRSWRSDALAGGFNYWRINPWRAPSIGLRRMWSVVRGCEFHGNAAIMDAAVKLWGRQQQIPFISKSPLG